MILYVTSESRKSELDFIESFDSLEKEINNNFNIHHFLANNKHFMNTDIVIIDIECVNDGEEDFVDGLKSFHENYGKRPILYYIEKPQSKKNALLKVFNRLGLESHDKRTIKRALEEKVKRNWNMHRPNAPQTLHSDERKLNEDKTELAKKGIANEAYKKRIEVIKRLRNAFID